MFKNFKTPQYLRSFFLGMSAIILPVFFQVQDIPKVKTTSFPDSQRVKKDYAISISGIRKEVNAFGYKN